MTTDPFFVLSKDLGNLSFKEYCKYKKEGYPCVRIHQVWAQQLGKLKKSMYTEDKRHLNRLLSRARRDVRKASSTKPVTNLNYEISGNTGHITSTVTAGNTDVVTISQAKTSSPKPLKRKRSDNEKHLNGITVSSWPYKYTDLELKDLDLVILGDVDGGQLSPISCSLPLRPQTLFVGVFGTQCPRILNTNNFCAGSKKEAADGLLQAAGSQLHSLLDKNIIFLVISDDSGYEMSCVVPWEQDGRTVMQYSPAKYRQLRDLYEIEKMAVQKLLKNGKSGEKNQDNVGGSGEVVDGSEEDDSVQEPPQKKVKLGDGPWAVFKSWFGM